MAKRGACSTSKLPKRRKDDASLGDIADERIAAKKAISEELILQLINDSSHALGKICGNAILSVTKKWSERTTEVLLVAILGVNGLEALRHASTLFPVSCGKIRKPLVTNFVNRVSTITPCLTEEQCATLERLMLQNCPHLARHHHFKQDAHADVLRNLREQQHSCAYAQILLPPVSSCIKEDCDMKHKSGPLSVVRQPIAVTVYDVDGGRPAAKISLRCTKCHIIYNYTTYGRKTAEGETYYGGFSSWHFYAIIQWYTACVVCGYLIGMLSVYTM